MYDVKYTSRFKKDYKRLKKRGRMVGIAADEHKSISFVFVCIGSHLDGKV